MGGGLGNNELPLMIRPVAENIMKAAAEDEGRFSLKVRLSD